MSFVNIFGRYIDAWPPLTLEEAMIDDVTNPNN